MPTKRKVTDVMMLPDQTGHVSYVLHPDHHEAVCPWCTQTLARLKLEPGSTYGELYCKLFDLEASHITTCLSRTATTVAVEADRDFRDPAVLH